MKRMNWSKPEGQVEMTINIIVVLRSLMSGGRRSSIISRRVYCWRIRMKGEIPWLLGECPFELMSILMTSQSLRAIELSVAIVAWEYSSSWSLHLFHHHNILEWSHASYARIRRWRRRNWWVWWPRLQHQF